MRHLASFLGCLVVLLGLAFSLDALAARTGDAGVVWVVTRGPSGEALKRLLHAEAGGTGSTTSKKGDDARLVNTWAGGRVVELRVASVRDLQLPQDVTWAALRLTQLSFGLPGCG
ncbi:MAG: hypothetical protein V4864_13185 [Pseudomonadota bacterium]